MRISDWSSDVCSSDLAAGDGIALTRRSIIVHQELGHDEKRDAFAAFRCIGRLGQHQMNDIVGQVMFARRYENLGARDGIASVRIRRRARTDRSEEHTSELKSLMRISYAVFCLKK